MTHKGKGKDKESEVEQLREEVATLKGVINDLNKSYYASNFSQDLIVQGKAGFPKHGIPASHAKTIIRDYHNMDSNEYLNTSSYVNVVFEPEEMEVAQLGMSINIADQTVYPVTFKIHDHVVNMMAHLWNCPSNEVFESTGVHAGAGTVGSTEACLLAGLALKFRWRRWFMKKHGLSKAEVVNEPANIVLSSMYQAAWEKLFKYMDIEPRLVKPSYKTMTLDVAEAEKHIDEHTIGVVCILGNHYSGHYDPVHEVNDMIERVNKEKGLQVGIHVDAASGGFIAPFQEEMKDVPWDFRLPNVLSISTSGHKFGESVCGTGWVVWREKKDLSEHVAISVSYLGGNADSYTLNFSRPASGIMVQFYKILRLGMEGYRSKVDNQMNTSRLIREGLENMTFKGKKRFIILDQGDEGCLPVVAAMLNPELNLPYDDIDLQHAISDEHWYVSGYRMQYHCPSTENLVSLFNDITSDQTMFRIVVKSNLTMEMGQSLVGVIGRSLDWLDQHLDSEHSTPLPDRPSFKRRKTYLGNMEPSKESTLPTGMRLAPLVRAFMGLNVRRKELDHGHQAC